MSKVLANVGSEDARADAIAAIMACTRKAPFLGRTISDMRLEFTADTSTIAATNGTRLRVNPDRFAQYDPDERVGIIAHEALHTLLQHPVRLRDLFYEDRERANNAADYAINDWLLGHGFTLPEDGLYDPQYAGMSARDIYHRLPQQQQDQSPQWGAVEPAPNSEREQAPPQEVSEAMAGAGLEELVCAEFGLPPRASALNLDRVLSRLLITDPVEHRSWRRPSHAGDMFPSSVERDERPRTVVCLDVSGSISEQVRETFLGVLSRVTTPVTVIAVDTHVRGVWRDVGALNHTALCAEMPRRGGGTRLQPGIDFAAHERANLVYLTDGETGEQRFNRRGVPIVWLVWGNSPNRVAMEPAGKIIMVET